MNVPQSETSLPLAIVAPEGFAVMLAAAMDARPDVSPFVTRWNPAGLRARGAMCLVTGDEQSGFAVTSDGELVGLFSAVLGRGPALIHAAVEHGAEYLSCFEGYLSALYAREGGFTVVHRTPFDPAQAPVGWPKNLGTPDYVYMWRSVEGGT